MSQGFRVPDLFCRIGHFVSYTTKAHPRGDKVCKSDIFRQEEFVKDAPVKIFDEPSSALDPIAEYELFQNIMKEGSDHTMLFISHRLSSVKNCDKVFMLEKGHLIEEGAHGELIAAHGSYAQMYKNQDSPEDQNVAL